MPYRMDWNGDHVLIAFSGEITFEQMREAGDAHYGDERLEGIKYLIGDFTRADLSRLTKEHVRIVSAVDNVAVSYLPSLRMAFVVSDDHQKELCASYISASKGFGSPWSHGIFDNVEEARRWCVSQ